MTEPSAISQFQPAGYEILHELTQGGMAQVFLGRRHGAHGFERLVAIKTIRRDLRGFDRMHDMFQDEARLMARLHHPNIAQVYDFGETDGLLYLVMEYVAGASFEVLAGAKLPPGVCARLVAEVCRGLHAAHELTDATGNLLGVVHRDISPQNLMVTFDGRVKILDFGIALMRGRQAPVTEFGTIKGKPPYMAPEQMRNEPLDHRTDIWAASNVLYELVTGEPLAPGNSAYEVVHTITTGSYATPSKLVANLPDGLEDVILRGLSIKPDDRYQHAFAMAQALDQVATRANTDGMDAFARAMLRDARLDHQVWLQSVLAALPATSPRKGRPTGVKTIRAGSEPPFESEPTPVPEPETKPRWKVPVAVTALVAGFVLTFVALREPAQPTVTPPPPTLTAKTSPLVAPAPKTTPPPVAAFTSAPPPETVAAEPPPSVKPPVTVANKKLAHVHTKAVPAEVEPPRVRAPLPDGFLTLAAKPYALVRVDGVTLGPTPIMHHAFSAGPHRVEFVSPDSGTVRDSRNVTVEPKSSKTVISK